jgi:hypothetical protein
MQGTEIGQFMNGGKPILRHPRARFKADNGAALLAAALAGLGVLVLPDFMIEPHVASGALVPVFTDYPPPDAGLYVVRPPDDSRGRSGWTTAPFRNFTVRVGASAAKTDVLGSTPMVPAVGSEKPTDAQSALNWRRLRKCLFTSRSPRARDNEL